MVYESTEITAISYAIEKRIAKQRVRFSIARAIDIAWLLQLEAKLAAKEVVTSECR